MDELGLDANEAADWFVEANGHALRLFRVPPERVATWKAELPEPLRRAYITDEHLKERVAALSVKANEIIKSRLPDPGSVMSGDFGEFIVYIFHAARLRQLSAAGPKKWRLKQDRTKPAPHSDVLHFVLPAWPNASTDDAIVCSEVKAKSTASQFDPIAAAIEGSEKDRISHLASTLAWLRDRALGESLGATTIAKLDRFLKPDLHPPAKKEFFAIAVICASLVEKELAAFVPPAQLNSTVWVIEVPDLKTTYEAIFELAKRSIEEAVDEGSGAA